jgi:hypothetical protein
MKRELVFFIVFGAVLFCVILGYWFTEIYDWPTWVRGIVSLAGLCAFTEIIPRLGPEKRDTLLTKLLRLSIRERTVLLIITPLIYIAIVLFGMNFTSPALVLLFMVASLAVGWGICWVLSGRRLGHFLLTGDTKDPAATQVKSKTPKYKNNR